MTLRLGLRQKIFALILVTFSLLVISIVLQIGWKANAIAGAAMERSLTESSNVLNSDLGRRFNDIREVAGGIASDGRVLPFVFDRAALTLQDLSEEFGRALDFDVLMFLDDQGSVLARSDRPEAAGQRLAGRSRIVEAALAGETGQGFFVSGQQILQMVGVPVFDNVADDVVRGAVLLAYDLSAAIADQINTLTGTDIAFAIFERGITREVNGLYTSYATRTQLAEQLNGYFSAHPDAWRAFHDSDQVIIDTELDVQGSKYLAVVQPLKNGLEPPLGVVMSLRSRTELLQPYADLQRRVVATGAVCLILASLFAWQLAQRLGRPILEMVALTQDIQQGNYSASKPPSGGRDEVDRLHGAIAAMGAALKEKADLEQYMALLTEESDTDSERAAEPHKTQQFTLHPPADLPDNSARTKSASADAPRAAPTDLTVVRAPEGALPAAPDAESHTASPAAPLANATESSVIDGRYRLLAPLGAGAAGSVYLATDLDLDERVAIKLINSALFGEPDSMDFREEIRLARRITHRNIVRIFDFGYADRHCYITMEYVAGRNLQTLLQERGAFDLSIGLLLCKQICYALGAAHEQGIIHRDLKPANIMINRQGILKVMDFGLAVTVAAQSAQSGLLARAAALGTPRFMAPEQFDGRALDERTDIYAIGVLAYALFTGAPPFVTDTAEGLAEAHLTIAPPPPFRGNRSLPEALGAVILRCLAKSPKDRYASIRALLDDLNRLDLTGAAG